MNMDDRLDLSPIDPEEDPERLDRVVEGVLRRLGPGIVHAPAPLRIAVARTLSRRFRPLCAAASVVAIAAGAALSADLGDAPPPAPVREVSAMPVEWDAWITLGTTLSTEDLLFAFAGDER